MQTLVENSYYVNKIQGLELAAEAYVKKENRKIEYQNQEKIYEEVRTRYDHTKGIFPQYVMFLIFGSIYLAAILLTLPGMLNADYEGTTADKIGILVYVAHVMVIPFCFIGGAFISKAWHRKSKKNSYAYKQALGSQYGFLSNQKSYLDAAERTWHDYCVTNGIPFDATLEDVNKLLEEARASQRAYFNSLNIEAAEKSKIRKEDNQNIINFSSKRSQSTKNNIPRHLIIDDCDTIYDYEDEADDVIYEDDDENYDNNSSYFEDLRNEDDELSHERHVREREEWQRDYDETMEDFILGF